MTAYLFWFESLGYFRLKEIAALFGLKVHSHAWELKVTKLFWTQGLDILFGEGIQETR